VMDRDAHVDRQWICTVCSQLEWFSNAPNALVSYRCGGSFRKQCSAPCIYAFTTLAMFTALAPAFPTSVLFLRAFGTLFHGGCACKIQRKSGRRSGRVMLHTFGTPAFFFSR
jgi:hypothetical protein